MSEPATRNPAHDRYTDAFIEGILANVKTVAMVGASAHAARPSYFVLTYLMNKGYSVAAINPGRAGSTIAGAPVYATLAEAPGPFDMVDVFRAPDAIPGVVAEVLAMDPLPKVLWLQLGIRNDPAVAPAEEAGITVVQNRCPKIEYGRLSGEISWAGVNSNRVSARKSKLGAGNQHLMLR